MIDTVLPTYNRAPLSFVSGQGSWLTDESGRRYLDLGAGIGVNALGHAHPDLVKALETQAENLWHVSNLYRIPQQQALADALVELTFADTVFFTNSGTEALELAVKMARRYWDAQGNPDRREILTFEGAFHGRSIAAISAAGAAKLTEGFAPLLPGFAQLPFADIEAVRAAISERTAAILIEPIQGEGGIRQAPDAFLRELRALCDETGALLILDEVQCGMGRTGRLFAHEWAGIAPDIMMVAKGIGGGFPLGAVLASETAAAPMGAGSHGSTYGGNPLGCAVGLKVTQIVANPEFLAQVNEKAGLFRQGLEGLVASHPDIFEEVRGAGLMLGLKCKTANTDLVQAGYDEHILTVPAADNVVRLLPPLNIGAEDIATAIAALDAAATRLKTGP